MKRDPDQGNESKKSDCKHKEPTRRGERRIRLRQRELELEPGWQRLCDLATD